MGKLIVKDNALIEASHRLSEIEQRLILLAIVKARTECVSVEQLKGREITIHADEYVKVFGTDRDTGYWALKKAVVKLFRAEWGYKQINNKGNVVVAYERFTQSAKYVEKEGLVKFKFADAIVPMLVELEKRFTVYEIEQVAQLSSSYAMRLYEFFMQHLDKKSGKGWLEISLEDLRFRFGLLSHEYERMGNFKSRVLDYSINEINKKTDLTATYEQRKQGRTITSFRFEFTKAKPAKTKTRQPEKQKQPPMNDFEGLTEQEQKAIQKRIDEYISQLEAKGEIISDFHRQNIVKKAIDERWGLDVFEKKQKKKQLNDSKKAIEQVWQDVPNGTRFRHKKDGSIWVREAGGLRNEQNRVLPDSQINTIFQYLEELA